MRAPFEDLAVLDEKDLIRVHQRAQPMGDDDRHAVLGEAPHGRADTLLSGGVDRCGGIIEDNHRGL